MLPSPRITVSSINEISARQQTSLRKRLDDTESPGEALPNATAILTHLSRRRLRRRWPGSRARLCLGRPARRKPGHTPAGSHRSRPLTRHAARYSVQPSCSAPHCPAPLTRIRRLRAQRTDPATLDGSLGRCPARTIQWKAFTMPETWKACPPSAVAPRDTGMLFRSADPASSPPLAGSQQSLRAFAQ
jgi:hypothetical protein